MRPYTLVETALSRDTAEVLEQLLQGARDGRIVGIAFCAMLRKRAFIVDAAGEAYRNPTFSRGMVSALDDCLARRAAAGPHGAPFADG